MNLPFEYDRLAVGEFGGTTPTTTDFDNARVVILPVPLDRTTSYVAGTRNGPHEILRGVVAHGALGRGNRDRRPQHRHLHAAGDGVSVRDDRRGDGGNPAGGVRDRRRGTSFRSCSAASTRSPRPSSPRWPRSTPGSRCCRSTRTPTCATRSWERRTTTPARCGVCWNTRATTQVGIRSLSPEEAAAASRAADDDLLRLQHAAGCAVDRPRGRFARRDRLHHHRLRRPGSGHHAGGWHAGAGRLVLVRNARAAPARDRIAAGGRVRSRRAVPRCPGTSRRTFSARS